MTANNGDDSDLFPDDPDEEFVEEQRATLTSDEFRQEILGEFVESGEKYLPTDIVMPCVRDDDPSERAALNAETTYLGVDVARAGDDRTVYIVMDEAGDVVRVESEETSKMTGVVGRIKRLDSEYDFARVKTTTSGLRRRTSTGPTKGSMR